MNEETMTDLTETAERLEAVAASLEAAAARLAEQHDIVGRMTATVEPTREAELERRLAEAETKIAELSASASQTTRKTLPASMATMLAKQGVTVESMEAGAVDGALAGLSIEQRIAVKAELMRAGLL